MSNTINKELAVAILAAVDICTHPTEEEGGIILMRGVNDPPVLYFVPVANKNRGTGKATSLYELDAEDMQEHIYSKVNRNPSVVGDWMFYASFHTHHTLYPQPSVLELHTLCNKFQRNVIYATKSKTFSYTVWGKGNMPGLEDAYTPTITNISLKELQQISYDV